MNIEKFRFHSIKCEKIDHLSNQKFWFFFENYWNNLFAKNQTDARMSIRNWENAHWIHVVEFNDEPVGMMIHNHLSISEKAAQHPYFIGDASLDFLSELRRMGFRTGLTFEYLTINSSFHRRSQGLRMHELMIELGILLQKKFNIHAALGKCRSDVSVSRVYQSRGGRVVLPRVVLHNTPTDFCAIPLSEILPPDDERVSTLAKSLFESKFNEGAQLLTA